MKRIDRWLARPWAAYTFAAVVGVVLYMVLSNLDALHTVFGDVMKLISPVITGVVVAYLFNPLACWFERTVCKKLKKESARHFWGVTLTLVVLVLALALLLVALIPSLVKSVSNLIANWEDYTDKIGGLINTVSDFLEQHKISFDLSNIQSLVSDSMQRLLDFVKGNVKPILSTLGNVGTSVSNFAFGIVFGFCFLYGKRSILRVLGHVRAACFTERRIRRDNEMFEHFHKVFIRYVGCTLLDALIVGVATLVFMLIMRMPFAPLIAMLVAITNIIPTVGPWIGSALGIFFLVLDKPLNALLFFIFSCILQSLDGMVIKPRLFSGSLGIPAVWTLVLIILGGKVAGLPGVLLAIPFAAIFDIVYEETIIPRLKRQAEKRNAGAGAPEPPETPEAPEAQ